MLSILQRMYDLTPNNPVTIIEPVTVVCSNINDVIPIGGEYLRHAFIVLQDADITVKNAAGNTIMRGTDYFTIARAIDSAYSKQYSTSIYSGIKFKTTGTYTVTSFITVGTYPRAGWFNYLFDQFLTLKDVTVAALSTAVSTMRSDLNNIISTVQSTAAGLSSLSSLFSNHAADSVIHITAAERAAWNNKTNTYFVATIAERDTLTGLKTGDRVVVWNDGDSKRAVYFYGGSSTWYKDSDPDWENISLLWSALSGIPLNVAAVVSAAGVTATATAGALAIRDSAGRLQVASPSDRADASNKGYVDDQCASISSGSGFVGGASSSADGNIVLFNGTTGKSLKDSGYSPSSFIPSTAACSRLGYNSTLNRVTLDGANSVSVAYSERSSTSDVSGYATNASNATTAAHQKDPNRFCGQMTIDTLRTQIINTFGTSEGWSYGVNGVMQFPGGRILYVGYIARDSGSGLISITFVSSTGNGVFTQVLGGAELPLTATYSVVMTI